MQHSLGKIKIRIPTPIGTSLTRSVDVVNAPIPLHTGLDMLDDLSIHYDNTTDKLICQREGWSLPVNRKMGHAFVEWNTTEILFTRTELFKLYRQFFHLSTTKLLSLLRRARPKDLSPETRKLLEDISKTCSTCQYLSPRPLRFKASLPDEEIVFNKQLALDVFFLDSNPALHIVDTHTGSVCIHNVQSGIAERSVSR